MIHHSRQIAWQELESAAIATLQSLLTDPGTPSPIRLGAALAVLEHRSPEPEPPAPSREPFSVIKFRKAA